MLMTDVFIFGTCRVCYINYKDIRYVKSEREYHSRYYKYNNINIFTQPVNYTTKLIDILDSLKYMTGRLYQDLNPNTDAGLRSIFFRGHTKNNFVLPNTHPCGKFGKVILECFSIKQYILNTDKYGSAYLMKNLPWKITTGYEHDILFDESDIIKHKMTREECFKTLDEIKQIVQCPMLIIGPYYSKLVPEHVNAERLETQTILKEYCEANNTEYFDLSTAIKENKVIERDEFHLKDNTYINSIIYTFITTP